MIANLTNVSLLGNGTDRAEADSFDPKMQLFFGTVMLVFGLIGLVGNVTALYAFCSSRRLRRPKNYVVANLCLTGILMCLLYCPVIVISSFSHKYPSDAGCTLEGFVVGAASIGTIGSCVAIAVERYISITRPMRSLTMLTKRTFLGVVIAVWIYSILLVFPPLVGWGSYVRESTDLSCTFDYISTDIGTRSYVISLLLSAFGIPLLVIGFCYARIFTTVRNCERKRKLISMSHKKTNSEIKTAVNAFIMTTAFCLCWCPYTTVAAMGMAGVPTGDLVVFFVALLAKLSVVINPVVYVFSIPSFRKALLRLKQHNVSTSGGSTLYSEPNRKPEKQVKETSTSCYSSPEESTELAVAYSASRETCLLSKTAAKRLAGQTKSIVDVVTALGGSKDTTAHKETWV